MVWGLMEERSSMHFKFRACLADGLSGLFEHVTSVHTYSSLLCTFGLPKT